MGRADESKTGSAGVGTGRPYRHCMRQMPCGSSAVEATTAEERDDGRRGALKFGLEGRGAQNFAHGVTGLTQIAAPKGGSQSSYARNMPKPSS